MDWSDGIGLLVWVALLGLWTISRYLATRPSARQAARWRAAARIAGLTAVEESRDDLAGRAGSLAVWLSAFARDESRGTRITVSGPGKPRGLTIRPEDPRSRTQGGAREVEVGDDAFDAAAWVEGPPALAHALLDADTRRSLQALLGGRLSIFWVSGRVENGVLGIDVPEPAPWWLTFDTDGDSLGDVLEASIELARRLSVPADVARRIAENMKGEPVSRVRLLSLGTLVREYPDHPATREALLAAREDPDAEVRLRAGVALGPEGRDVLRAIAGGEGATDDTTSQAVSELAPQLTVDEATGLLKNALRTRRLATVQACMGALGRRGGRQATEVLARVLAVEKGELGGAAARALGETGDPTAEPPLLRALADGTRDVRLAAATALGRVGTAAAVGPLREAEEGDAEMRRTARQAIAEIQSRLTGAGPGQLSLAGGESGQLSLASEERGRLSLVPSSRGSSAASGDEGSALTADPSGPGKRSPSG
jgi:hypothetical protein